MVSGFRRSIHGMLAAACFVLVGGAHAVVVKGEWDPSFEIGGSYERLGFRGEAFFFIPDDCLAGADTSEGPVWVGSDTETCAMSFQGATLQLYDFYDPAKPTLDEIYYGYPIVPDPVFGMAIDLVEDVNTVIGIDTDWIGWEMASVVTAYDAGSPNGPGTIYSGPVWLSLSSGYMPDPAFIALGSCLIEGETTYCEIDYDQTSDPAVVTITVVPEPGTIALLLSALGVGWLVRRRPVAV